MKVVLLAPLPPPIGGIAGWTKRMTEAKLNSGWQVVVVDEKVIGGREVFGADSKKNYLTEIKRCFRIWRDLFTALNDKDVGVVHSCIPSATLSMMREYVCAVITKLKHRKFIIHFRCTVPNTTQGAAGRFLLKRLCNLSDSVLVLNRQSLEFLRDITTTKISLIPNFISLEELAGNRTVSNEIKTAVYVGGVIKEKGCDTIIEAAENLPDIRFRLIGKADEELAKIAETVSNVELVGVLERSEVMREMQAADVFVFLSRYIGEGFSNALAEAMALGLPCIVTDWAANADMIENKGGIVVKTGSAAEVAAAFEAMKDKTVRQRQSDFNINKVRNHYSSATVLDMYVELYEELMGRKA